MATKVAPFGPIELAVMALLVRELDVLGGSDARVGGDMPREVDDFYIRIDRVPGGRTDSFEGDFVVDIEVFSADYVRAGDIAADIEALMLAHGIHTVISGGRRWTFDGIFQNVGISDIPWESDDDTHRLLATYSFTVRRSSATGLIEPAPIPEEIDGLLRGEGPPPADLDAAPGTQYLDTLTGDLYTMGE